MKKSNQKDKKREKRRRPSAERSVRVGSVSGSCRTNLLLARLYPFRMNRMCKNLENLSIQSVFMLSPLRLRHAENLAGEKKPEKTRDFEPSRMDKVEIKSFTETNLPPL